jgi:hypothetical protein
MCGYRLCEESADVFDFKINEENLKNCFQSLRQYYETTTDTNRASPNEAEFRSYIILLNLNESNILSEIQRWPKHIRHSPEIRFALSVYFAYNARNYVTFFRLVKSNQCQYLQACILHRYFYKIRNDAFKAIFSSYKDNKGKIYPLDKLVDLLGFDDVEAAVDYCCMYGLEIIDDSSVIMRSAGLDCFVLPKSEQDKLKARRSTLLIESKFYERLNESQTTGEDCLSQIISGGETRPSKFSSTETHTLLSSFDDDGHYVSSEIDDLIEYARQKIVNLESNPATTKQSSQTAQTGFEPRQARPVAAKPLDRSQLKSTAAGGVAKKPNALLQRASSLVKKAQQTSISKQSQAGADKTETSARDRKKSASSNSSETSDNSVKPKTKQADQIKNDGKHKNKS